MQCRRKCCEEAQRFATKILIKAGSSVECKYIDLAGKDESEIDLN